MLNSSVSDIIRPKEIFITSSMKRETQFFRLQVYVCRSGPPNRNELPKTRIKKKMFLSHNRILIKFSTLVYIKTRQEWNHLYAWAQRYEDTMLTSALDGDKWDKWPVSRSQHFSFSAARYLLDKRLSVPYNWPRRVLVSCRELNLCPSHLICNTWNFLGSTFIS